jgi:hypothetical protein
MRVEHIALDGTRTVSDTRTLAEAQAEAVARIDLEFAAKIAEGMAWHGKRLQIDDRATANMTAVAAFTTKANPLPADFAWRMADNSFLPMNSTQQATMAATAAGYVMSLRRAMWAAKDAARAAITREEADAVQPVWPGDETSGGQA